MHKMMNLVCDAFRRILTSEVEELRLCVATVDDGVELSSDVGMLNGYVVVLVDVVAKVIEFEDGLVGAHLEAHALPLARRTACLPFCSWNSQ